MSIFDNFLPHYFGPFAYFIGIVLMLLALNLIIFIHELGHLLAAKSVKLPVPKFSIGFGPTLFRWKWGETDCSFNIILLGGYIALSEDLNPDGSAILPEHKFSLRPIWRRMWVTVAGVVFNFALAIVVMMIVVPISGVPSGREDVFIHEVMPDSPALRAGFAKDDQILAIGGKHIDNFKEMASALDANKSKEVNVLIKRGNGEKTLAVTPNTNGKILVRIGIKPYKLYPHNPVELAKMALQQTWGMLNAILTGLWKVVTGQISLWNLSSPVMVVKVGSDIAQDNVINVLVMLAFISIDIGLMNLLPLPALDGGRLFFLIGELIARRPLPAAIEGRIHQVGFALLMTLGLLIIAKDIFVLVTGKTF